MEESDSTTQPHRSNFQNSSLKNDVKDKNVKICNRNKGLEKRILKIDHVAKYNKCQGYKHLAVDCTSSVKIIIINGVPIVAPESGSIIPSNFTPVIKGITDIILEDSRNKLPAMCDTPYTIEPVPNKFTFQLGEVDSDTDKEITWDDIGLNCIRPTLSTHLSVVRRVPSQPVENDDWKKL